MAFCLLSLHVCKLMTFAFQIRTDLCNWGHVFPDDHFVMGSSNVQSKHLTCLSEILHLGSRKRVVNEPLRGLYYIQIIRYYKKVS